MAELPDDEVLGRLVEAASPIDLLPPVLARVPAAVERVNALRRSWIANGRMREDSQTNDDLGVVTLAAAWAENGAIAARVRAEAVGAAAGPVSVGAVRDAAAAMVRWCDDPTASPTVLGSILAPLVPAVRAEALGEFLTPRHDLRNQCHRLLISTKPEIPIEEADAQIMALVAAVRAEAVAEHLRRIEAVLNASNLFAADAPHNGAAWRLRADLLEGGAP